MTNDERYIPVAKTLPETLPPINQKQALHYASRLTKVFGRMGLGSPNQKAPAALWHWDWSHGRRCWAATKPTAGHRKGWGRLVHDVSHLVFHARHPTLKPHAGGHATLEREIAEYVVAKGWLAPRPEPAPKPDPRGQRYILATARLKRWESKRKRAETAIKKLRRQIARHERDSQS